MEEKIDEILKVQNAILESQNKMQNDITTLKEDVGVLQQDVGTLKEDVGELKGKVDSIDKRIMLLEDSHEQKLDLIIEMLNAQNEAREVERKENIARFRILENTIYRVEKENNDRYAKTQERFEEINKKLEKIV